MELYCNLRRNLSKEQFDFICVMPLQGTKIKSNLVAAKSLSLSLDPHDCQILPFPTSIEKKNVSSLPLWKGEADKRPT